MDKTELYTRDLTNAQWRKASYSAIEGEECVEVAHLDGGAIALRDSNNHARGDLRFTAREWSAFTAGIRADEFNSMP